MLKKSAFFDFLDRGDSAEFEGREHIEWNGYLLPLDYGDAKHEYFAIRKSCALFDVSPMRKIRVQGDNAGVFFDYALTRPVSSLPAQRAIYVVFCDDDGNLKDDAIIYKFADDDYLLLPSDIDHSRYFESLCADKQIDNVTFAECTATLVGVAVQGPCSAAVLTSMGFGGIEQLKPFEFRSFELAGKEVTIGRMGFTADLGYECWLEPELSQALMRGVEDARSATGLPLPGYGLTALDTCRLEGGFIVAGWDCSTEVDPQPGFERSPYDLGLGWLVDLDAADFVGRDALLEQKRKGHPYTLRSFAINVNSKPADGAKVYATINGHDTAVGTINCSSWSWGLGKMIGNASLRSEHKDLEKVWTLIDETRLEINFSREPLIDLAHRNRVPPERPGSLEISL